jgi:O-antigen/teichoic acid export membrane protein
VNFNSYLIVLEKPAFWSIGVNVISVALGSLVFLSLGFFFGPNEQGLYFTFVGLGSLAFVAEFGIGQTIIQSNHHFRDDPETHALFKYSIVLWYRVSVCLLLVAFFIIPLFFNFEKSPEESCLAEWITFSIAIACNFYLSKDFYLMQGEEKMLQYWRFRFFEFGLYSLTLLILILLGFSLWSLVIASSVSAVVSALYINRSSEFLTVKKHIKASVAFDFWLHQVAKLQFKVGVISIGNNSITRLITPLLFLTHSAVTAGQYGMSLSLVAIGYNVANVLINIKLPTLSALVIKNDFSRFEALFSRGLIQALTMFLVILILEAGLLMGLIEFSFFERGRLLDANEIILIAGTYTLLMLINFISCYMRCFRVDYLAGYSVLANVLVLMSAHIILKDSSLNLFLTIYLLVVLLQFAFSAVSFSRFRKLKLSY